MPVEIREIIIRAIVEEKKERATVTAENRTALWRDGEEQVLKIIQKKKER